MSVWMGEVEGLDASAADGLAGTLAARAHELSATLAQVSAAVDDVFAEGGASFRGPHAERFGSYMLAETPTLQRLAVAYEEASALLGAAAGIVREYEVRREQERQAVLAGDVDDIPVVGGLLASVEATRRGDRVVADLRADPRMAQVTAALERLADGLGCPLGRDAARSRATEVLGAPVVLQDGDDPASVLGDGDGPVEVTGAVDGYTLGRAYVIRRDGIVYLVEVDGGQTADDALREIVEDIEPDLQTLEDESTEVQVSGTVQQIWSLQGERPDMPSAAADAGGGKIRIWTNEADGVPIGADGRPEEGIDHWTMTHEWGHVFDDGQSGGLWWRLAVMADSAHRRSGVPEFDQLVTVKANGDHWDNLSDTGIGTTQYGDDPDGDTPGDQGAPVGNNGEDFADALALWTLQNDNGYIAVDPSTGERYTFADLFPARARYFEQHFG